MSTHCYLKSHIMTVPFVSPDRSSLSNLTRPNNIIVIREECPINLLMQCEKVSIFSCLMISSNEHKPKSPFSFPIATRLGQTKLIADMDEERNRKGASPKSKAISSNYTYKYIKY